MDLTDILVLIAFVDYKLQGYWIPYMLRNLNPVHCSPQVSIRTDEGQPGVKIGFRKSIYAANPKEMLVGLQ